MAAQPQYTYQPQPNELPYYNALFTTADKSSSGHLSGAVAVEFLSLSKLPVDLLKQIWTMADQPPSNTLDMNKFYVAGKSALVLCSILRSSCVSYEVLAI